MNGVNTLPSNSVSSVPQAAANNNVGENSEFSLNDIFFLVVKVNQERRDILQKLTNQQSIDSFKLAATAVKNKLESANKTRDATILSTTIGAVGAGIGGLGGAVPAISRGVGKLGGGGGAEKLKDINIERKNTGLSAKELADIDIERKNTGLGAKELADVDIERQNTGLSAKELADIDIERQNTGLSAKELADINLERQNTGLSAKELADINLERQNTGLSAKELADINLERQNTGVGAESITDPAKVGKRGFYQRAYDFGAKSQDTGMLMSTVLPPLTGALGAMAAAGITREASRLQTAGDFINNSQSSYERQHDNAVADARQCSQKMNDSASSIVNVIGALMNAMTPK